MTFDAGNKFVKSSILREAMFQWPIYCNKLRREIPAQWLLFLIVTTVLVVGVHPTLADSNLSISVQQALEQLDEVLELIEEKYYTPIDYDTLLKNVLLEMKTVVDHPETLRRYSINAMDLKHLRQKIRGFN